MCDRATGRQLHDPRTSDETLAERARRGSGEAFGTLVRVHGEAIYAIARNMSATARDAEEVVQEAIAMKTALAHREAHHRSRWGSLQDLLPAFDGAGRLVETKGRWPELDGSPSEQIRVTGLLREALECIDDGTRAAFVLRDLVQLPVEEVAVILQKSPQGVSQDAHRARLMLRRFVDGL
ncbi:MAG: sigma-70 family RNA polymerase sigma factor [Deltaproteobacteria bacterium]|nr:MAG: sigma-70 family RNA polymerase sigma factor [Deltaproteobacteria bacterium]